MPVNTKYLVSFEEGKFYHVYNRTNNREPLFIDEDNRRFFLEKLEKFVLPFAKVWAWCLLENHFHLLIQVRDNAGDNSVKGLTDGFSRLFKSYSVAFNNLYQRTGNLFQRPYKRVEITQDAQLTQTVVYIHANPLKHNIVDDFTTFKWSSYLSVIGNGSTKIERKEILQWFGGRQHFIETHKSLAEYYYSIEKQIEK